MQYYRSLYIKYSYLSSVFLGPCKESETPALLLAIQVQRKLMIQVELMMIHSPYSAIPSYSGK